MLRHQRATLLVTCLTLAITVWLYVIAPKGFLPDQDTGLITAVLEAEPQVSFTELSNVQQQVADAVKKDPAVAGVVAVGWRRYAQHHAQRREPQDHAKAAQ